MTIKLNWIVNITIKGRFFTVSLEGASSYSSYKIKIGSCSFIFQTYIFFY